MKFVAATKCSITSSEGSGVKYNIHRNVFSTKSLEVTEHVNVP